MENHRESFAKKINQHITGIMVPV